MTNLQNRACRGYSSLCSGYFLSLFPPSTHDRSTNVGVMQVGLWIQEIKYGDKGTRQNGSQDDVFGTSELCSPNNWRENAIWRGNWDI